MSMLWRNWVAFIAVLATVLAILGTLSFLQYSAIFTRLVQERLSVIAETTASSFRPVIDLGLPISMVRNAGDVLASAKEIDPAVSAIEVFHPTGIVVHSTSFDDRDPIAKEVLLRQSLSSHARWTAEDDTRLLTGLTLRNSAGEPIGGILVSAEKQGFEAEMDAMALRIVGAAAITLGLFSALALAVLRVRLDGAISGLRRLERLSADVNAAGREVDTAPVRPGAGPFAAEIARLETLLEGAVEKFELAQRQLTAPTHPAGAGGGGETDTAEGARAVLASTPETSLARTFARHLVPPAATIVLGAALALGVFVHHKVNASFEPEFTARTEVIGNVANRNIQRAIDAGVPLTNLVGAETYFDDLLAHFPEVSYFGIATGRIVYEAGTRQDTMFAPARSRKNLPSFPITADGEQIGYIIIDANPEYFALQFRDVLLDFAVVVLVVMLLAYQTITVLMSRSLTAPFMQLQYLAGLQAAGDFSKTIAAGGLTAIDRLGGRLSQHAVELNGRFAAAAAALAGARDRRLERIGSDFGLRTGPPDRLQFCYLNDIRLPVFLFAAADELPLAFFPLFVRAADSPLTWLDLRIVISLPLAGYLLAIVFGSPLARPLAERLGHRRLLLVATVPTLLAHLGLYFSTDVIQIVLFRSITGFGYALATLCCQDYVLDAVPREARIRSLGQFTAAMFGGIFAGTALGGVLADRLGYETVFAVSAVLVLISGILIHRLLPEHDLRAGEGRGGGGSVHLTTILKPLRSLRFAALVLAIAIPANVVIQAFISFLVALTLDSFGASAADIGRILMTYFLGIAFVGPLAPRLFERWLAPSAVALLGAVVCGVSLCAVVIWPASWSMLVAVAGAGIGHGMVRDTQIAIAMEIAERELGHLGTTAVLGSLRMLERLASIVGLIAIAAISSQVGYINAIAAMAALVLVGAAAFAPVAFGSAVTRRSPRSG